MTPTTTAPSPQLFFETINAFQRTAALKAAVDLRLFTAIGGTPSTAAEIAARCECPERGIRILSDNLAILGFLTKDGPHYALTPSSAVFLDKKSPAYFGDAVKFLLAPALTEAFTDLASTIRRGRLHTTEHGTTAPNHPAWVEFARAMGPLMMPAANGAADLVPLDPLRDTRVLDISSSHGAFGIAFAKRNPRAHLIALDWEAVLAITQENATAAGLAHRFSKIAGNAFTADLGSDYDAVLVPNFLHHFNIAECTTFLRRVHAALRPGGRVVIVEFAPHEDRITPPAAASRRQLQPSDARHHAGRRRLYFRRISRDAGRGRIPRSHAAPAPSHGSERRHRGKVVPRKYRAVTEVPRDPLPRAGRAAGRSPGR